jgi:hypothetical protein
METRAMAKSMQVEEFDTLWLVELGGKSYLVNKQQKPLPIATVSWEQSIWVYVYPEFKWIGMSAVDRVCFSEFLHHRRQLVVVP